MQSQFREQDPQQKHIHSVHWGINPLKPPPPSFLPSLPFLGNPPSLKVGFFSELPKYYSFSSLTPYYLLKVTKFLVEIFQFEFLVMTEKNIFCH